MSRRANTFRADVSVLLFSCLLFAHYVDVNVFFLNIFMTLPIIRLSFVIAGNNVRYDTTNDRKQGERYFIKQLSFLGLLSEGQMSKT